MDGTDIKDTIFLTDKDEIQLEAELSSNNNVDNNNNITINNKTAIPKQQRQTSFTTAIIQPSPVCISFKFLSMLTATCQIAALIFCLTWSIKFDFYASTATHCQVTNFLPSLSATLEFTPQRDVWVTTIGLFGGLRYFISYLYHRLIYNSVQLLVLHWIEITALIGLSVVDSLRYFEFHAFCVGIFLITSVLHQFMVCLNVIKPNECSLSEQSKSSLKKTKKFKTKITLVNFIVLSTAIYLYDLHNKTCIPGIYSLFSASEYIFIGFNIIYHLQAYHDLGDFCLVVMSNDVYSEGSYKKVN